MARRKSGTLTALFAAAIACIIAGIYFVVIAVFHYAGSYGGAISRSVAIEDVTGQRIGWWRPDILAYCVGCTLVLIGAGSFYKMWQLRSGGAAVALSLGGKPVLPQTADIDERKLLNVVEEMAIATGMPVPMVFVMRDEEGINAFAAGRTPQDAVVGVTLGCMRLLKRDELQGVIAHEFSHILHGDMRLNLRLIGLIHGILLIGLLGAGILRGMVHTGGYRSSRSSRGGNKLPLLAVGAALFVLGYAGVFFGRLIKAAVARQREFLADASAVKCTRNPDGLSGALKKIGGYGKQSRVLVPEAEQASHLFFGDFRVRGFGGGLLSTHPPLKERILRIDPGFDGTIPRLDVGRLAPHAGPGGVVSRETRGPLSPVGVAGAVATVAMYPDNVVDQVGSPTAAHLAYGSELLASIPAELRQATGRPVSAACLVFGLLLESEGEARMKQVAILEGTYKPAIITETLRLCGLRAGLSRSGYLPLVELACPALRRMSRGAHGRFMETVRRLAEADERTTLFEFALEQLLARQTRATEVPQGGGTRYLALKPLLRDAALVLSVLARVGDDSDEAAQRAFAAGWSKIDRRSALANADAPGADIRLLPRERCTFSATRAALGRIASAAPAIKERVLRGMAHCVLVDGHITLEEADLLRAIAAAMDCPLPPFLPSAVPQVEATS